MPIQIQFPVTVLTFKSINELHLDLLVLQACYHLCFFSTGMSLLMFASSVLLSFLLKCTQNSIKYFWNDSTMISYYVFRPVMIAVIFESIF